MSSLLEEALNNIRWGNFNNFLLVKLIKLNIILNYIMLTCIILLSLLEEATIVIIFNS